MARTKAKITAQDCMPFYKGRAEAGIVGNSDAPPFIIDGILCPENEANTDSEEEKGTVMVAALISSHWW